MARFERVAELGDVNGGELAMFGVAGHPVAIANVGSGGGHGATHTSG